LTSSQIVPGVSTVVLRVGGEREKRARGGERRGLIKRKEKPLLQGPREGVLDQTFSHTRYRREGARGKKTIFNRKLPDFEIPTPGKEKR